MAQEPMMEEQPGQPPAEGGEGGDIATMVKNLGNGLTMISQMIAQTPDADPADIQEAEDISQRFQDLIMKLSGAGGEQPAAVPAQGAGKTKPVPVQSMAGKPVSPAGM